MEKDSFFYAANVEPEIARMFKAYNAGQKEVAEKFKNISIKMVDEILTKQEISSVGREEWFTIRNMIEGYENLDTYMKQVLLFYGRPFSEKFMKQFD